MAFFDFVQTSAWKNFMAKLYGIGASVVITGALFKIQHWKGAGLMLTLGMLTEATIFFFSAFEPLHEELDWTLVYPELAGISDPDEIESLEDQSKILERNVVRIEELIGTANISEESIARLGEGLTKLSHTANSIADLSLATIATKKFVDNLENAAITIENVKESYSQTTETIKTSASALANAYKSSAEVITKSGNDLVNAYSLIAETIRNEHQILLNGTKDYENQLSILNKNLSTLNAVYEMQIKDAQEHLKDSKRAYEGIEAIIKELIESAEATGKYREEISKLRNNLESLNNIYGNMLSALSSITKSS